MGSTNNLYITNYTLSVDGFGTHRVPAQAVCQNKAVGSCSYSYPVQFIGLPNGADYAGQVAAENVAGSGQMCSLLRPQTSGMPDLILRYYEYISHWLLCVGSHMHNFMPRYIPNCSPPRKADRHNYI